MDQSNRFWEKKKETSENQPMRMLLAGDVMLWGYSDRPMAVFINSKWFMGYQDIKPSLCRKTVFLILVIS